jgi:uncharacterized HAD superfamily protein
MRNNPNIVVGCDLDGVIGDIVKQLVRFSRSEHRIHLTRKHIVSENIETCTPIRRDQLHELFENPEFFRTLPAMPRARESLSRLKAAGCAIHIITDRFWYSDIHADTREWLKRYQIPFDSVVFARKAEKHDVAERLKVRYFVEDQLSNARLLAPLCKVLLLDRPYNQGEIPDQVTRVDNLKDVVAEIVEGKRVLDSSRHPERVPLRCPA